MKTIFKNTSRDIIVKARKILKDNCITYDDMLKGKGYTCYTVQKTAWGGRYFKKSEYEFLNLGYRPKVQSEDEDFITYILPDYFL